MRELILIRHAKSDWPDGVRDLERPLSERGRRDCAVASEYFRTHENLENFEIFVSEARRTQETWNLIASNIDSKPVVHVVNEIYEASLGELINFLEQRFERNLVFVGHNPGLALLGSYLTNEKILKFPTLSIWHLATDADWHVGSARTLERFAPRAVGNPNDTD